MEPFQELFLVTLDAGNFNGGTFITVPAGKRAVIEHASVHVTPQSAGVSGNYFVVSTNTDSSGFKDVPIVVASFATAVIGSHSLRAYANAGTQFGGVIRRLTADERIDATFVLAGQYVSL